MAVKTKVEGVAALRKRINEVAALADKQSRARAATEASSLMDGISRTLRDAIRWRAAGMGWPRDTIRSIFKSSDLREGDLPRSVKASLVGARKGAPPRRDEKLYREWRASGNNTSPRKKRGAGELIGMSLAAMYENGTTRMLPRPAFRPAYDANKSQIRKLLIAGYKRIIESFNA
jgi:hypothetical protein